LRVIGRGLKILHGVEEFIRKTSSYVLRRFVESFLGYIFSPFIVKRFRDAVRGIDNVYDALNFAFSF
jgi:hypothetical protein